MSVSRASTSVRFEGIDETLSDTVQLTTEFLHLRMTEVLQVFQFEPHRTQHEVDVLHRQTAYDLGEV